jgi:hypothetical protein
LNTIKRSWKEIREIANVLDRQNDATKTLSLLFAIYRQFPKLNVAGSIPVSRSKSSSCPASPEQFAIKRLPAPSSPGL